MTPQHITDPAKGHAILALLQVAFAGMHARIDPPSSLHALTVDAMFATGEVWAIILPPDERPVACMILTPRSGALYIGKFAVAQDWRGSGLARVMIDAATRRARTLHLPVLTLQTRVELIENHIAFLRLGFVETGRTCHAGFSRPTTINFQRPV